MQELIRERSGLMLLPRLLHSHNFGKVTVIAGRHLLNDLSFESFYRELKMPAQLLHPPDTLLQPGDVPVLEPSDAVVAIGGGKVIDFAKGVISKTTKPVYFIAVPTTAGSGSEATPFAVFYQGQQKISIEESRLLPNLAVLDPVLLENLPPVQRAISGADALAQCIESLWNRHTTRESEQFALDGLATLWQHLPSFVLQTKENVADDILWAAHLSGKAIAITRTTGPHALSYFLTARYGVPHGHAVGLFLPLFFVYNNTGDTAGQLRKMYRVLNVDTAEEARHACEHLFQHIGLATSLREIGFRETELEELVLSVNRQRFANNPAPFDPEKLKALIRRYLL